MRIYTSYFSNAKNLPATVTPVSISLSTPNWFKCDEVKELAPPEETFDKYKNNPEFNDEEYIPEYVEFRINPFEKDHRLFVGLLKKLFDLTTPEKPDIALLCWEGPLKFCHRSLVKVLFKIFHINIEEFDSTDSDQYQRLTHIKSADKDSYVITEYIENDDGQGVIGLDTTHF